MKKNKIIVLLMTISLMVALFAGCAGNETETNNDTSNNTTNEQPKTDDKETDNGQNTYEDGFYFATEDEFVKGWKGTVTIEVKDGKIADVDWNPVSASGGLAKKAASAAGNYPMVANGGAQTEWHEQAEKAEAYLIETQDPTEITYKDEDGHTDDIAGVSIHVNDFYALVEKALEAGPQEKGPYKDGAYSAEEDAFAKGWKGRVDITVLFGRILAVNWDPISEEDPALTKKAASAAGDYGMVAKGGAQAEWHEQAAKAEAYLIETQDPTKIEYIDEDGHTDDIAGVSIHVNDFYALVEKALENAK